MKVFLSWSGDRSKQVAKLLDEWLPLVIQQLEPWMSTRDIDAGSMWDSELQSSLQTHNIGIVCLTQENKEKPWILFEAGALSKGLTINRVFTFLIDLQPEHFIKNPLSKFNHTVYTKDSIYKLIQSINKECGEKALTEERLSKIFNKNIDDLMNGIDQILKDTPTSDVKNEVNQGEVLLEVLETVRGFETKNRALFLDLMSKFIQVQKFSFQRNMFKSRPGCDITGFFPPSTEYDMPEPLKRYMETSYYKIYGKVPTSTDFAHFIETLPSRLEGDLPEEPDLFGPANEQK